MIYNHMTATNSKYKEQLETILKEVEYKNNWDINILYIALYGSQNYELATENSDFDAECFIFPSFEDLAMNKEMVSYCIDTSLGTCHIKDIRMAFNELRKSSPNILEVFSTEHCLINDDYFMDIRHMKDDVSYYTRLSKWKLLKGLEGLFHRYSQKVEESNKYVMNVIRISEMIERVIADETYPNILVSYKLYQLQDIREKGIDSIDRVIEKTKAMLDDYFTKNESPTYNSIILSSINQVQLRLMKKYFDSL